MPRPTRPQYTSEDLWSRYFKVRMNYLQSRSVDYIRQYGIRISESDDVNRYLDTQEITTQLNINAMFEKWRSGVTINVISYGDTVIIYEIIHAHLVTCAEFMANGVNHANLPLQDLIQLDEFASKIYDKARPIFSQQERISALATNFQNGQGFNFANILKRSRSGQSMDELTNQTTVTPNGVEVQQVTTGNESKQYPDRTSYRDIFAEDLARIEGWRGKL